MLFGKLELQHLNNELYVNRSADPSFQIPVRCILLHADAHTPNLFCVASLPASADDRLSDDGCRTGETFAPLVHIMSSIPASVARELDEQIEIAASLLEGLAGVAQQEQAAPLLRRAM